MQCRVVSGWGLPANLHSDLIRNHPHGEIYNTIKLAAKQLAEENGWDIVIINDSISQILDAGEQEVNAQISGRRFLYAAQQFDVSDQLIARLNR